MQQCFELRTWRDGPDKLLKHFSRTTLLKWLEILPDRAVKGLLDNTGFTYKELTREMLMEDSEKLGIEDASEISVVLLAKARSFPPTTFYWQYYTKRLDKVLSLPELYQNWGLVGEPWIALNVMLATTSKAGPRLFERVCIGHVHQKQFEKADPHQRYMCIG